MSRWLTQVTDFLERIDDQAQDIVEENINEKAEEEADAKLDSILAQRGLTGAASEEDDNNVMDDDTHQDDDASAEAPAAAAAAVDEQPDAMADFYQGDALAAMDEEYSASENISAPAMDAPAAETKETMNADTPSHEKTAPETDTPIPSEKDSGDDAATDEWAFEDSVNFDNEDSKKVGEKIEDTQQTSTAKDEKMQVHKKSMEKKPPTSEAALQKESKSTAAPPLPPPPPPPAAKIVSGPVPPSAPRQPKAVAPQPPVKATPAPPKSAPTAAPSVLVTKDPNPALIKEAREAQREVRTLRRHVVALNKQLEAAEEEVAASRNELDQTGGIMEKERAKAKLERDEERKKHAEELKTIQEQHEKTIMEQKTRLEKLLAEKTQQLSDMEHILQQEGGNFNKELQGSVEREQILTLKNAALEDEKATLLAQIHTLQSQQENLGDRVESLSQTADSAMQREREAEERLDQALSVHAHQISQRQNRERELERQLADLGAAMAALKSKESSQSRSSDYSKSAPELSEAGENPSQDGNMRVRLDMALHDLEATQANLDLERQRTEALQRELKDISNERTEEATNARIKQNKHDRQIAELTLQISRMQQEATAVTSGSSSDLREVSNNKAEVQELKNQVKELSEEVLKSREKTAGYSSEMATMKSRLKSAIDRANKAERDLEDALATDRMERGVKQGMRRRGTGKSSAGTTSISSAMHLDKTEKVAKVVDSLDSFSVSTGKYLRGNPVARAAFIFYLLVLHLYTFAIILFHAHNFENIHRSPAEMPHGPNAMMQNQLGAGGQAIAAAAAAAKKTP